jgi:hypothetical protein
MAPFISQRRQAGKAQRFGAKRARLRQRREAQTFDDTSASYATGIRRRTSSYGGLANLECQPDKQAGHVMLYEIGY